MKKPDVRERTIENGIAYPDDEELIMLILGSGNPHLPVQKMARKIFNALNDSNEENRLEKLLAVRGVGEGKALAIAAALELGRRRTGHLKTQVLCPRDILPFIKSYAMSSQEHFLMVTLNGGHEIIKIHLVTVGTSTKTIVHAREVFREAIKENATAIIICHNHPSGNCRPSDDDICTTKNLMDAGYLLGIPVIDHIVFSCDEYFSFLEHEIVLGSSSENEDEESEELAVGNKPYIRLGRKD